jgi:hypothetical protein
MAVEIPSESLTGAHPEEAAAYKESRPVAISRFLPAAKFGWRSRPTPRWTRRNFSSRARELSGGDAIVISIPNSGRTWVRTFLCAYVCARYEHPFSLHPETYHDSRIPRIIYTHDRTSTTQRRVGGNVSGANSWSASRVKRARLFARAHPGRISFRTILKRSAILPRQLMSSRAGRGRRAARSDFRHCSNH